MAVFIEARTEPFEAAREDLSRRIREDGRAEWPVRRPTRGYQLKPDTYAVMRIMGPDGEFLPVIDAAGEVYSEDLGGQTTTFYSNFFIQSVTEQRHEKQQIVDTFGDSYIFFFGEAPRLWNVNGFLLNTADFNWRAEFWHNYERFFRGTRLVELGARLYLIYDDIIVEGYMMSANVQESAAPSPQVLPFQFQMFLTGYTNISAIGDPRFPQPGGDIDYSQLSAYDTAFQNWRMSRNAQRELTEDAVIRANQQSFQAGTGKFLTDAIKNSIITGTIPSIAGLVSRAYRTVTGLMASERSAALPSSPERTRALRTSFQDNLDEYINLPEPSARELAAPLSMADRWLEMDQSIDNAMRDLVTGEEPFSDKHFYDTLGRMGRAENEIHATGGDRAGVIGAALTSSGIGGTGQGVERVGSFFSRDVPFGMTNLAGTLT
jgi:hypothetical protein